MMRKKRRRGSFGHLCLVVEPLEDRILLAADDVGLDLLLGVDDQGKKLQLVDLADGSRVLQEQDLNSDAPFLIQGSAADDRLQ